MGRVLHDNERAFPNEIPRSLSQSQEARTESQSSQESEPGARAGFYRVKLVSKISSHSVICFKLVQNLQNETKLPLIDLSLTKMTEEF